MAEKVTTVVVPDAAAVRDGPEPEPDVQVLDRFRKQHDEAAFLTLLQRHGPMVLGVCRRVLGNSHDAEDAFQATFLTLVQKAGAISRGDLLAYWLYRVAYRTALRAKTTAWVRRLKERQVGKMAAAEPAADKAWGDVEPILDEELQHLPRKYRLPLVLCYFQGKSKAEAAREMGCPEGTVSGQLARAREMLRKRLAKRGVAVSMGLLLVLLAEQATAAVPAALAQATATTAVSLAAGSSALVSPTVLSLTEGASGAMSVGRKVAVLLVALALLGGTSAVSYNYYAQSNDTAAAKQPQAPALQPPAMAPAPSPKPPESIGGLSAELPPIPKNPASAPTPKGSDPAAK